VYACLEPNVVLNILVQNVEDHFYKSEHCGFYCIDTLKSNMCAHFINEALDIHMTLMQIKQKQSEYENKALFQRALNLVELLWNISHVHLPYTKTDCLL